MAYSWTWLSVIAMMLFAAGTWVESYDEDPTVMSAVRYGGGFIMAGAGLLAFNNLFGPLG